jgi:hypothetical protein
MRRRFLPTPTSSDAMGSRNATSNRRPHCRHSGMTLTDFVLISSAAASPVSLSPSQVVVKAGRTRGGSGPSSPVLLASLNPDGSWSRTSPDSGTSTAERRLLKSCRTWPDSGMMRNGRVYLLPSSGPRICVIGSLLLPPEAMKPWVIGEEGGRTLTGGPGSFGRSGGGNGRGARGGIVNPTWTEWLLGLPSGWTDCESSATRSSRRLQSGSAHVSSVRGERRG